MSTPSALWAAGQSGQEQCALLSPRPEQCLREQCPEDSQPSPCPSVPPMAGTQGWGHVLPPCTPILCCEEAVGLHVPAAPAGGWAGSAGGAQEFGGAPGTSRGCARCRHGAQLGTEHAASISPSMGCERCRHGSCLLLSTWHAANSARARLGAAEMGTLGDPVLQSLGTEHQARCRHLAGLRPERAVGAESIQVPSILEGAATNVCWDIKNVELQAPAP